MSWLLIDLYHKGNRFLNSCSVTCETVGKESFKLEVLSMVLRQKRKFDCVCFLFNHTVPAAALLMACVL